MAPIIETNEGFIIPEIIVDEFLRDTRKFHLSHNQLKKFEGNEKNVYLVPERLLHEHGGAIHSKSNGGISYRKVTWTEPCEIDTMMSLPAGETRLGSFHVHPWGMNPSKTDLISFVTSSNILSIIGNGDNDRKFLTVYMKNENTKNASKIIHSIEEEDNPWWNDDLLENKYWIVSMDMDGKEKRSLHYYADLVERRIKKAHDDFIQKHYICDLLYIL